MSANAIRWTMAFALALVVHIFMLSFLDKAKPAPIEIAGGIIVVNLGSAGNDTAAARADRGGDTTGDNSGQDRPEPAIPPELDQQQESLPEPEPLQESEPLREPEPEPVLDPEVGLLPEPQPERPPESPPVADEPPSPTPNPPAVSSPETDQAATPTESSESDAGTQSESLSEEGQDAEDSVASPVSGASHTDATTGVTNTQAGNAAASNYAGKIVRILSQQRLPASVRKGAARVSFSLSGEGSITRITIKTSSGSKRFDRAAIRLIQSCAPFPRPPQGAELDYTVVIKKD
ncbi:MAG: TonB family protein [Pseudomonadota bacterium]